MFRCATAAFALALTACESVVATPSPAPSPESSQNWLCGREYVNHAWGYQRRGVVFDIAGNVWKYELRGGPNSSTRPWSPTDVSRLTEADLKMRYESAMTTGQKISASEIAAHVPLIEPASQATPTKPQMTAADMGQHLTYCYTYDETKRVYGQVMIDNRGDWTSTNPSPAARKLAAWIGSAIGTDE